MIRFIKMRWRRFFAALTFLTIIPVPGCNPTEDEIAYGKSYFSLVGLVVGAIIYCIMQMPASFMPPAF
ncbi:MAG: adenosylcobinamide-GDP ribazoletransferase, partial [Victivallales bacterium]|nr:adenosylcobinamide-GDP ribazoletransferase [Victivallales bacterium]